jgi:hypothetical protein
MDPRSNSNSGLGLPQPGNDMGPLPPIHTPQAFHAPDTAASHFATAQPQIGAVAPTVQPLAAPVMPQPVAPAPVAQQPQPAAQSQPAPSAPAQPAEELGPVDDADTTFDEEWVNRAREVVEKTHADPFIQSQELSKLKAQYIKLRYNKDIKVSE